MNQPVTLPVDFATGFARKLASEFARMVREREPDGLEGWLSRAEQDNSLEIRGFATSLRPKRRTFLNGVKFSAGLVSLPFAWFLGKRAAGKVSAPVQLQRYLPEKGTVDVRFRRSEYAEQISVQSRLPEVR